MEHPRTGPVGRGRSAQGSAPHWQGAGGCRAACCRARRLLACALTQPPDLVERTIAGTPTPSSSCWWTKTESSTWRPWVRVFCAAVAAPAELSGTLSMASHCTASARGCSLWACKCKRPAGRCPARLCSAGMQAQQGWRRPLPACLPAHPPICLPAAQARTRAMHTTCTKTRAPSPFCVPTTRR